MSYGRPFPVLFRLAAGPKVGFGHVARCRAVASALGVAPRVSVRGSAATRQAASRLGLSVVPGGLRALDRLRPAMVVVDDPSAAHARPWVDGARRRGIPVAALCDGGIGHVAADLVIDGSVRASATAADLAGPRYAVVDPRVTTLRRARPRAGRRVCIAVGGGAHVFSQVPPLVAALARRSPDLRIDVAPGFTTRRRPALAGGQWIPPAALASTLAVADVAVVAGGLTAYEACALGVPAVAVAVVPAQQPTVRGLAKRRAVVDGGPLYAVDAAARISRAAAALIEAPARRQQLARTARQLVDGRGAERIATALRRLVDGRPGHA